MFTSPLHGSGRCSQLLEELYNGILENVRCRTKKADQKLQGDCAHVGDVEVVRDLDFTLSGKEKEVEGWKQLHVGGVDGIGCHHFQVMISQLLQRHREWQEDRWRDTWQGSDKYHIARMDIKTPFDVARLKNTVIILGE